MTPPDQDGEMIHPEVPQGDELAEKRRQYQEEVDAMFQFRHQDGSPFTPEQINAALDGYEAELTEGQADVLAEMLADNETTGVIVAPDSEELTREHYLLYRIAHARLAQRDGLAQEAEGYLAFRTLMQKNHWQRRNTFNELLGPTEGDRNAKPEQAPGRKRTQPPQTDPPNS